MIENRVPDAGVTRVVTHNGQYQPFPYSAIPLDPRGIRGAISANYAESLSYHLKEASAHSQHQFARPLLSTGKVTSSYRYEHETPINLVQKEAPPPPLENNFHYFQSLQSSYLSGHPSYPGYPAAFNNPYLSVPCTQTKSSVKQSYLDANPPVLPVPVSSPVKTSVEVKNAPAQFKVPSKTRHHPYKTKRNNNGPPPSRSNDTRPVEVYPEITAILADSKDAPDPEDELQRFHRGVCVWNHQPWRSISASEEIQKFFMERDLAQRVESSTEENIISVISNSSKYDLHFRTVLAMRENNETGKVVLTLGCETGDRTTCEKPIAYPFLVRGRGWCSYSPEETKKELGWAGGKLEKGDTFLCLSKKESASDSKKAANARVEPQQNGHHESKVSPYKNDDLKTETRSNNTNSRDVYRCSRQEDTSKHTRNDLNNYTNKNSSAEDSEASRNKMRRWSAPEPYIEKYR